MRCNVLLVLAIVALTGIAAYADDRQRFDVSRAWFKPELQLNKRPEVCGPIFQVYFNYYVAPGAVNPLEPISSRGWGGHKPGALTDSVREIDWVDRSDDRNGDQVRFRVAESRQGGRYVGIVEHGRAIGLRPHYYQYFLLDKPPGETLSIDGDGTYGYGPLTQLDATVKSGILEIIYQSDSRYQNFDQNLSVQVANIYTIGGDVYLALTASEGEMKRPVYYVTTVISPQKLGLVCKFTSSPSPTAFRREAARLPSFGEFERVTSDIMGGGGDCGTMNAPARARDDLREGLDALIERPWAYSTTVEDFNLSAWGYSGAWNYRKFLEYKTILPKVRQVLADRYVQQYRLSRSDAVKLANTGIMAALARGFGHGDVEDEDYELHHALLEGRTASEIESLLSARQPTKNEYIDSPLVMAIGHPRLVELLLKRGFDPNEANAFGKTALMYAAQFNDLESARLLVRHGASMDQATTHPLDSCNYTIQTHGVTALHYAVRYASQDFIAWLVEAGAVKSVKDSNGRAPLDYLTRFGGYDRYPIIESTSSYGEQNRLLTKAQRDSLAVLIAPESEDRRRRASDEESHRAESLYHTGRIEDAYAAVKRALSWNPGNEQALANMSLIALKIGHLGEGAKAADYLIKNSTTKGIQASAYFNMGLACEAAGRGGFHYATISYDGANYCQEPLGRYEGPLHYFVMANQTAPSASRAKAIIEFFDRSGGQPGKWLCRAVDSSADPRAVYISRNHVYFLARTGTQIDFSRFARREGKQDQPLDVKAKDELPIGNGLSVFRWEVAVPFQGAVIMGDQLCSRYLPAFIEDGTEMVVVFTQRKDRPVVVKSRTSKPIVLALDGDATKWTLSGDSRNIRAVYVQGKNATLNGADHLAATVRLDTSPGPTSLPTGGSFRIYSERTVGLRVAAVVDVGDRQTLELDDVFLNGLPPCDNRGRGNCRAR